MSSSPAVFDGSLANARMEPGDCPRCGSTHVQSFDAAWQQGTSRSFQNEGWVVHQTDRAARAAPPVAPQTGWQSLPLLPWLLLLIFGGVVVLTVFLVSVEARLLRLLLPPVLVLVSTTSIVITIALLVTASTRRRIREREWEIYRQRFAEWQNSWVCVRCSETWIVGGVEVGRACPERQP